MENSSPDGIAIWTRGNSKVCACEEGVAASALSLRTGAEFFTGNGRANDAEESSPAVGNVSIPVVVIEARQDLGVAVIRVAAEGEVGGGRAPDIVNGIGARK